MNYFTPHESVTYSSLDRRRCRLQVLCERLRENQGELIKPTTSTGTLLVRLAFQKFRCRLRRSHTKFGTFLNLAIFGMFTIITFPFCCLKVHLIIQNARRILVSSILFVSLSAPSLACRSPRQLLKAPNQPAQNLLWLQLLFRIINTRFILAPSFFTKALTCVETPFKLPICTTPYSAFVCVNYLGFNSLLGSLDLESLWTEAPG